MLSLFLKQTYIKKYIVARTNNISVLLHCTTIGWGLGSMTSYEVTTVLVMTARERISLHTFFTTLRSLNEAQSHELLSLNQVSLILQHYCGHVLHLSSDWLTTNKLFPPPPFSHQVAYYWQRKGEGVNNMYESMSSDPQFTPIWSKQNVCSCLLYLDLILHLLIIS